MHYRVVKSVTDGDGEHLAGELIELDVATATLLLAMGEVLPVDIDRSRGPVVNAPDDVPTPEHGNDQTGEGGETPETPKPKRKR